MHLELFLHEAEGLERELSRELRRSESLPGMLRVARLAALICESLEWAAANHPRNGILDFDFAPVDLELLYELGAIPNELARVEH